MDILSNPQAHLATRAARTPTAPAYVQGRLRLRWACLLLSCLTSCTYDIWSLPPCEYDPESCENKQDGLAVVANCPRHDDLQIDIGQGQSSFVALSAFESPVIESASGGGQSPSVHHFWAALRVRNPAEGHAKFRAVFHVYFKDYYSYRDRNSTSSAGSDHELVYLLNQTMVLAADGSVSRAGLRVVVSPPVKRITLDITDECGRKGHADHQITN